MKIGLQQPTKIGSLIVEESPWSEEGYPGFRVSLNRKGKLTMVAQIEVDQIDPDEEPVLKVHVYLPKDDDPVSTIIKPEDFDR